MILGRWKSYEELKDDWDGDRWSYAYSKGNLPESFPREDEIIFASYGGGSYEGDAFMLWKRNGKLYEATGSHCSCYGLEGQFKAEETSLAALKMRERLGTDNYGYHFLHDHDGDAAVKYWALVDAWPEVDHATL